MYGPQWVPINVSHVVCVDNKERGFLTSYPIHYFKKLLFFLIISQAFPDEGLANVVRNVFDFDSYHPEVKEVVTEVLHKHGIPVGASTRNITLSKE